MQGSGEWVGVVFDGGDARRLWKIGLSKAWKCPLLLCLALIEDYRVW